jgi:hypothetical protein
MKKTLTLYAVVICLPCFAQITNVNIGSYPNAGNGDTARTAFDKINNNFDYVESQILSLPTTNAPIFLDTTLQGVTTNSGIISGGSLSNIDGTGVANVNAAKLNGYSASNFIASGSQMNFDGGDITSDGNGNIKLVDGDIITAPGGGVFANGGIVLTNNGTPEVLAGTGQAILFYDDGSLGFFPTGNNGGFYGGADGHANFGGANNEIYFDSGDGGIWTQGGSGNQLDDGSGNMTVENSLTVNGKLTVNGGTDPPYVLLDTNSEAAIKGEVEYEVATNKICGAALFWNTARHAMEIYCPSEDSFYDVNGNRLATNVTATVFVPIHAILHTITTQTNGIHGP